MKKMNIEFYNFIRGHVQYNRLLAFNNFIYY